MDLQYATSGTNRACERHALRLNLRVLKGAAKKAVKGLPGRESKLAVSRKRYFSSTQKIKIEDTTCTL